MKDKTLKKCKRCKKRKAKLIIKTHYDNTGKTAFVYAAICGNCGDMTNLYKDEKQAVDAWNNRVESK